jgi:hypothetical protein
LELIEIRAPVVDSVNSLMSHTIDGQTYGKYPISGKNPQALARKRTIIAGHQPRGVVKD